MTKRHSALEATDARHARALRRGPRALVSLAVAVLATVTLALAPGCRPGDSTAPPPGDGEAPAPETEAQPSAAADDAPRPRIVLLVSIDTLRADHLGVYGYERFTSPTIDVFASEGTVFDDASAAAPWTLPSHASMLTGLFPRTHEAVTFATSLDPERATLARMLADQGFDTAAAVSATWLRREKYNLTKDFDEYVHVDTKPWRRSPSTWITDQAIEWITEAGDAPLFVFLHYFDVHGDYASEPEYEAMFVSPYDGPADGTSWQLLMSYLEPEYIERCRTDFQAEICSFGKGDGAKLVDEDFVRPVFDARDLEHIRDLYDAGVRQMDTELGRLFAFLRKEGLADETLVVLTSDHGEEFLEHGRLDHFLSTHQEVLHVPLILRGPGVPAGRRIAAPVSLVDLVPTVLELTGAPVPPDLEGLSLVPLLRGEDDAPYRERPLYGEAPGGLTYESLTPGLFPVIRSLRRDRWKLLYDSKADRYALYDLSTDPLEERDVSKDHPAIAERLAEEMRRRYEGFTPAALENANVELTDEEIEQLRALGYVP